MKALNLNSKKESPVREKAKRSFIRAFGRAAAVVLISSGLMVGCAGNNSNVRSDSAKQTEVAKAGKERPMTNSERAAAYRDLIDKLRKLDELIAEGVYQEQKLDEHFAAKDEEYTIAVNNLSKVKTAVGKLMWDINDCIKQIEVFEVTGVMHENRGWENFKSEMEKNNSNVQKWVFIEHWERAIAAINLFKASTAEMNSLGDLGNHAEQIGDFELAKAVRAACDGLRGFDTAVADAMKLHVFDAPSWNVTIEQQRFNLWYTGVFANWKLYVDFMADELTTEEFLKRIIEKKGVALKHVGAISKISSTAKTNEEAVANITEYLAEHKTELDEEVCELILLYSTVEIKRCGK